MANVDITRIASNIGALNALNSLQSINSKLAMHQTRLSTGKRINSAADDPAGLVIATKMLARSEGLKVTLDNISDAKNMLAVAEGGMGKITDIIIQMRNKAEQAASDTLGSSERATIATQLSAYANQIQDIIDQTKWNGVKLLDNTTGSKVFQTGVDEGENTTWSLPGALDPATMLLSKKVAGDTATTTQTGTSYNGNVATGGLLGSLTELTTGDYSFKVLDKSTAATTSKATLDTSSSVITGASGIVGTVPAVATLTSGRYSLKINSSTTTATNYTLTNLDDSTFAAITATANLTTGVITNGAAALGITLTGTNPNSMVDGQSMTFEYIKAGDVKIQMNDASGQAMQINRVLSDASNVGYSSAYVAHSNPYTSGRGVSMTLQGFAAVSTSSTNLANTQTFTYERANNYSVNVSSATRAGQYMTTANAALDTVNTAMSDLGSLMARLNFKEESQVTAQVNVEAAYSRIMNANMAEEQMNASKYTILQQTGVAMLAQANQAPQSLLTLFR